MSVDRSELLSLSPEEKLRIIEMLWDDLGTVEQSIPLPDWIDVEAARRRDEMVENPEMGLTHEEAWTRIKNRKENLP